jgi:hypothetical protein
LEFEPQFHRRIRVRDPQSFQKRESGLKVEGAGRVISGKVHMEATPYKACRPGDQDCGSCTLLGTARGKVVPCLECMWRREGVAPRMLNLGT